MSDTFKLKVNDTFEFTHSPSAVDNLDLVKKSENQFHLIDKNQSFDVRLKKSDFYEKKYTVLINDTEYKVTISNQLDLQISKMGLQAGNVNKENDLKAPMPGLIVSIETKQGEKVNEGDGLLILEAMKMENTLVAPKDGVVKTIAVKTGAKVEKNELLIELE